MHEIINLIHQSTSIIVDIIDKLGYFGIFAGMFLESSFFPFPSEVIMIPAGYLAFQGKMNIFVVIIVGIIGSLAGSWLNYLLAKHLGRKFLVKIISNEKIDKLENFFKEHGHISTFTGRLIPGLRQYISFPAGLAKMCPVKFTIYTGVGAGIWVIVLTVLGYYLGANQDLVSAYLKQITIITLVVVFLLIIGYLYYKKRKKS